jgi:hypothetical protein
MMTDQEVVRLRFFERNPDLALSITPNTTPTRTVFTQRIGPFTPVGSVKQVGSAAKHTESGGGGTKMTPSQNRGAPVITHIDEDVIKVDVSKMSAAVLPKGGKKEADMIKGLQHLQNNRASMDIDPRDFKMFTYWIREKEIREHMEHTLRSAIAIAKSTNQTPLHSSLLPFSLPLLYYFASRYALGN